MPACFVQHRPAWPESIRGRSACSAAVRSKFSAMLGWAVRSLAAGELLVAHPQHHAVACPGCPSAGGQLTIGRPRKETPEYDARCIRRDSGGSQMRKPSLAWRRFGLNSRPCASAQRQVWNCPDTGLAARATSSAALRVRNRPSFPLVATQHLRAWPASRHLTIHSSGPPPAAAEFKR